MRRLFLMLPLFALLAACGDATRDLQDPVDPIGDFQVGHIAVVAPNLQKLLVSRDATKQEWIDEIADAVSLRFDRYNGGKFYHFGISVEAYSLPPPIIPGKSALALNVTLWDDAAQAKMNDVPEQVQIIRIVETRLASTKESQMRWLAAEAAKEIEIWMREKQESDGWFAGTIEELEDSPGAASLIIEPESDPAAVVEADPITVPDTVLDVTQSAASGAAPASQ